jgi:hypothetical protein
MTGAVVEDGKGQGLPEQESPTAAEKPPAEAMKLGPLLDEPDEEKAFRLALKLWNRNKKWHHRQAATYLQNKMWREGDRFLKIVEDPSSGQIRVAQPLGTSLIPPIPNTCDSKIRSNIAIFLADPPRPECEPWDDTPQARNAAQYATRVLTLDSGEAGLNTDAVFAGAVDVAATFASAFTYVSTDPKGAGLQPMSVQCHPDATRVEEAELGPPGAPSKAKVSRYVRPDGTLSKSSKGAKKEWAPKVVLRTMNGNHLRFLPRNVSGIDDANGIIFAVWDTLGSLKSKYERVRAMNDDEIGHLVNWKVDEWKRLMPDGMEAEALSDRYNDQRTPDDDALVLTLHVYYKSHSQYPYGAYCCFGGGKFRLYKRTWTAATPTSNGGEQDEMMDLPIAQARWYADAQGGNPYGKAPAAKLGPMDEIIAAQYAALQEFTFRFSKPRPYLPMGTTIQPEDLADYDKPLFIPPGGQPYFPPIPNFPQEAMNLVDRMLQAMDEELSTPDAARGIAAGSVRSAEQQKTIIEQGLAGTSVVRASFEDYYERLHRLILQQRRAFFTTPQLMRFQDDGGAFQVNEFRAVDLGATREVRVRRGTFTLMAPTAKAGLIGEKLQGGMITPQEAMRLDRENMAPLIGIQENPHVQRVKRQLSLWRQGPTEEQKAQGQQYQQALPQMQAQLQEQMGQYQQQAQMAQQQGQPPPPPPELPPDPLAQAAGQIFAPVPVDADPAVAMVRYQELGMASADAELGGYPEPWVQALYQAAEGARQAAGIVTIAEQQQQAQQAQQAQQQAEQAKQQQASSEKDKDRADNKESAAAKEQAALDREGVRAGARQSGMMA